MKLRYWLPGLAFIILIVFLAIGLTRDPRAVPSPLIGRPAPAFDLPELVLAAGSVRLGPQRVSTAALRGRFWLLNVWASWCVSCREEHPLLVKLAQAGTLPLIGLDYKDSEADAQGFLQRMGNPYTAIAWDASGRTGIDYGVYGVPETYLIDPAGVIRYKHIGPLTEAALNETILPLVRQAQAKQP